MKKITKELIKAEDNKQENLATKNLFVLKKSLAELGKQSIEKKDLETVGKILDLLTKINKIEQQPITYIDAYQFLRSRRFAVDFDIQEDDLESFKELFKGELNDQ